MICITEQTTYFKLNKDNIEQYKKYINNINSKKEVAKAGLAGAAGGLVGSATGLHLKYGIDWKDALHHSLPLGAAAGIGGALAPYAAKKIGQYRIKKYEEKQKNNKK